MSSQNVIFFYYQDFTHKKWFVKWPRDSLFCRIGWAGPPRKSQFQLHRTMLVCSGYHTKHHRLDSLNSKTTTDIYIFANSSGGYKSKVKVLTKCGFLLRPVSLASRWPLLAVSSHGLSSVHVHSQCTLWFV